MKCCYCGKGMNEGKNMIPIEPKGTPGRKWACTGCVSTKDVSQDVREICELLNPNFNAVKRFELGKCYKHTTGTQMKIVGEADTTIYGKCLIGENPNGEFNPVGTTRENAINWSEISEKEWMKNFSK